ncbi:MAG: hypothetical protein HFG64_10680 [Lachnospiraceae bacterium]|nr:hypothetical protein [Lachnospiraceae bacterium]
MDKLVEFLINNILVTIIGIVGVVFPGVLTIFLFNRELFINLDTIKLLILSVSITINSFVAIMFEIILIDPFGYPKSTQMSLALIVNILIFLVMLSVKLFWRDLSTELFVAGIIILFGLFSFVYWVTIKKDNKKS